MNEERYLGRYWVLYYGLYVLGASVLLWLYWGDVKENPLDTLAKLFAVSAGGSLLVTLIAEIGGRTVLLIPAAIRKYRAEGEIKGHAKGSQETQAKWTAWLERYREAQAAGEEFTEPPPSLNRASDGKKQNG